MRESFALSLEDMRARIDKLIAEPINHYFSEGNNIGADAIRGFHGALSLKKAHKGIFVTTSAFSQPAIDTARGLGSRIVLIDGLQLSRLMIRYNVGCRDEDVLHLKKVDEDFFEG
jgi:restriction system protein